MAMSEYEIHLAIYDYLNLTMPGSIIVHVPNQMDIGGSRIGKAIAQKKAKRMGMLPGFPDILIFTEGQGYCLEVKAEGGRLSSVQKDVRDILTNQGIPYAVVRSVDDVRETLAEWGVKTKEAVK